MAKLTPSMRKVLENLNAGRRANDGFPGGRSVSGGLSGTMLGLRRRGFTDLRDRITDAGRAALAAPSTGAQDSAPQAEA